MRRPFIHTASLYRSSLANKVKAVVCATAILVLVYIVFVQGWQNVSAQRGARAAEGIRMTSEQADDVSRTTGAVGTLIAAAAAPSSSASSSSSPPPLESGFSSEDAQPQLEDGAWYVVRIEDISGRWEPAYSAAKADIERFEHRFRTAEDRLSEYFDEQRELTGSVSDSALRAELRLRDSEERSAYTRWTEEGRKLLNRALAIERELDDMDVVIRKQQLTVSMLSEYSSASSIPSSAQSLHRALGEFRLQSDELASDLSTRVFN